MPAIDVLPIRQEWHRDVAELVTLGDVSAMPAVNGDDPGIRQGMYHVTQPILAQVRCLASPDSKNRHGHPRHVSLERTALNSVVESGALMVKLES